MKQSLFRTIRQKLFTEGKLVRYLGYAVGEILLIIVGILFTLKINDWNEEKKAQAEFATIAMELVTNSYRNGETILLDGGAKMPPR